MAPVTRLTLAGLIVGLVLRPSIAVAGSAPVQHAIAKSPLDRWQGFIDKASRRFGVPEAWIRMVMRAESGGHTMLDGRPITSPAGAMGLMQLMPKTYAALRVRYGLNAGPYDPKDNILAGTAYLRELYQRFGYPDLFAAYNAGPTRFAAFLDAHQPLPTETRTYIARLGGPALMAPGTSMAMSGTRLFFHLRAPEVGGSGRAKPALFASSSLAPSSHGLFVSLNIVPERKP